MNALLPVLLISISLIMACSRTTLENTNQTNSKSSNTQQIAYITQDTEYYSTSPTQGRPADGLISKGTKVTIKNNMGSYSLITIPTNVDVYVASNALRLDSK